MGFAAGLSNPDVFTAAPWDLARGFRYPSDCRRAPDGDFLVIDHSGRRISRIDARGNLEWQIEGGHRSGGFYVAEFRDVTDSGGVWVINRVRSLVSGMDERTELRLLEPGGSLEPAVWSMDTPDLDSTVYNRLPYFTRMHRGHFFFLITDARGNTLLHDVDTETGSDRVVRTFPGLDAYQFVSAEFDPDTGRGWFLDNNARLSSWSFDGGDVSPPVTFALPGGQAIIVPSEMQLLPGTDFLLLDGKGAVRRLGTEGRATTVFDRATAGMDLYISGFNLQADGTVVMANEADHSVLSWPLASPGSVSGLAGYGLAGYSLLRHLSVWILSVLGAASLAGLLFLLYTRVMRQRTPLLCKQLSIFLPVTVIAVLASSLWIFRDMMDRYGDVTRERQMVWAQLGANLVSATDIDALGMGMQPQGDIMESGAFGRLTAALQRIVNGNSDPWNESIWCYLYVPAVNDWYVFDQFTYFERYLLKPAMQDVVNSGRPAIVQYEDAYSSWLSAFAPVLRGDGSVAALLEVTMDRHIFAEITGSFQGSLMLLVGLILVVLVAITFVSTWLILLSIRSLQHSAALISQGNYDVQVNIRSRDEIEDLGEVFNQMSREIRSYVDRVMQLNQANARFVPSQFLTFLGKDSIADIRLGDQVQRTMTVLFSDIRSFTTLSEQMTPEENFNFINRYLMEMGPVIRQEGGFIDKYIGDAIMALFPSKVEDGLRAALAMYANLERMNLPTGPEGGTPADSLEIGVGLHTGKLMLGIIGEAERFDGTVISDTVNLASRLESLTKYYHAGILVSGQVMEALGGADFFESRLLDRVQVKGKSLPVEIHEVLVPGLPGYGEKRACRPGFARALDAYFQGDFPRAEKLFEGLAAECPRDGAIPVYRRRMQYHAAQAPDRPWTGITILDSK